MITHLEFAANVENNDWVKGEGERPDAYVYTIEDDLDIIVFDLVDEDGEHYVYRRAPFDSVEVIDVWEDDEDIFIEDLD